MANGATFLLILQSEPGREGYAMRSSKPGAVDIDPIAARQWRRRPPLRAAPIAPAIAIAIVKNKTSDRAAPAAPAARTASCSPRELTTRPRLARAREYDQ